MYHLFRADDTAIMSLVANMQCMASSLVQAMVAEVDPKGNTFSLVSFLTVNHTANVMGAPAV
jgi:hypothetical protein